MRHQFVFGLVATLVISACSAPVTTPKPVVPVTPTAPDANLQWQEATVVAPKAEEVPMPDTSASMAQAPVVAQKDALVGTNGNALTLNQLSGQIPNSIPQAQAGQYLQPLSNVPYGAAGYAPGVAGYGAAGCAPGLAGYGAAGYAPGLAGYGAYAGCAPGLAGYGAYSNMLYYPYQGYYIPYALNGGCYTPYFYNYAGANVYPLYYGFGGSYFPYYFYGDTFFGTSFDSFAFSNNRHCDDRDFRGNSSRGDSHHENGNWNRGNSNRENGNSTRRASSNERGNSRESGSQGRHKR